MRGRLEDLTQSVEQRDERNKNAADPVSLAKANNMMRRPRRPVLAIRFQEDDLLSILNGSAPIPIGNLLPDRHQNFRFGSPTISHPRALHGNLCVGEPLRSRQEAPMRTT